MKNRKLLFFFSDETCTASTVAVPTLMRLANEMGLEFESYIATRPWSWQGKVLPMVGNSHLESFFYLANFYDEILYCSLTDLTSLPFRREVLAFGGHVVSSRKSHELVDFYADVFAYFGRQLPARALVIPDRPKEELQPDYGAYTYPDILHNDCVGMTLSLWEKEKENLASKGVVTPVTLYCTVEGAEVLDALLPDDTYGSVTQRIADRHLSTGRQIGFVDPQGLCRWMTQFCRDGVLALYEPFDWEPFMKVVKQYADQVGNNNIIGNQLIYRPNEGRISCYDGVVAELGKYNLIHNLVGLNPRIGFTVQTQHELPIDWMADENAPTPWDDEMTDEELLEKLEQRATPVCFMFYAADLGHLPVLTRFLDLMCLDGMKGGISFPSTWYDYHPELLEQLYIPLQQGGVCPNLEPLISSVGVAVATEAEGYIKPEFLKELITRARADIEKKVGKRLLPRGYYPFQDSTPFYKKETGVPQYDVLSEIGFEYYITYKNGGQRGKMPYQKNGMTVMTQQVPQWFPGAGNPVEVLKNWEAQCAERREAWKQDPSADALDWITLSFDTPFFALAPTYLGDIEYDSYRNGWAPNGGKMHLIYEAMQYVRRTGGKDGSLFMVKPHELYRYILLAQKKGLIKPEIC